LRATQICDAARLLYRHGLTIREHLGSARSPYDARQRLTELIPGIGPKQASLFLRNIGYTDQIAVLDSHVITYMTWAGLLSPSSRPVSSLRSYESAERVFLEHASTLGYDAMPLDMSVWIVVRVVKKGA
jgi:N-glycosylase/DNA lyase